MVQAGVVVQASSATVVVDGHRLHYADIRPTGADGGPAGGDADAPALLMLHGMASDHTTWTRAATALARRGLRVVTPDLLGHGASDKPPGRYALEDFAHTMSALLDALNIRTVTVVGHSFGGAVAMQMAHDDAVRVQRLVLVAAGGLGRQVHPLLRAATLPGAHLLVRLTLNRRTASVLRTPQLHRSLRLSDDVHANLARAGRGLTSPPARSAFFETLRGAITPSGQRGSMLEMDYSARDLPTLIVWSAGDVVLPVAHARATHSALPNSRLEIFPGTTHQPHHHCAARFAGVVADFLSAPVGPAVESDGTPVLPSR